MQLGGREWLWSDPKTPHRAGEIARQRRVRRAIPDGRRMQPARDHRALLRAAPAERVQRPRAAGARRAVEPADHVLPRDARGWRVRDVRMGERPHAVPVRARAARDDRWPRADAIRGAERRIGSPAVPVERAAAVRAHEAHAHRTRRRRARARVAAARRGARRRGMRRAGGRASRARGSCTICRGPTGSRAGSRTGCSWMPRRGTPRWSKRMRGST